MMQQLTYAPQTRCADDRTVGQIGQSVEAVRDQRVAGGPARHHGGDDQAGRQFSWHVFQRVHRNVGGVVEQGGLQFLDEQTLAAHLRQRPVAHAVSLGHQRHQPRVYSFVAFLQRRRDIPGLPLCKPAFAGGDTYGFLSQN